MLAPAAAQNDKAARFSTEAVDTLGRSVLLGLMAAHLDGYDALREASAREGFFNRPFAESAD